MVLISDRRSAGLLPAWRGALAILLVPLCAALLAAGEAPVADPLLDHPARDQTVTRANELLAAGRRGEAITVLEARLVLAPDDDLARQALLAARIAELEAQIRVNLTEQAETKDLIIGDPEYEAARARAEVVVAKRLDVVEYFVAQGRFPEAVDGCNAILLDFPGNPAVLMLKLKVLRALQRVVNGERHALVKEKGVRHNELVNEVIDRAIMPREKEKLARTVLVFDEDVAAFERQRVRDKLQERIDLILANVEVRKVIENLFSVAGINYVIRDDAIGTETLTIHLVNESIETALAIVSKQVSIRYNYIAGTVYISSSTSDVLETEIIRLESGLTDIMAKAKLANLQAAGGGGGQGGQGQDLANQLNPFAGAGGEGEGEGEGERQPSDLQRFLDKIPDLIVGWPAEGVIFLELKSNTIYVRSTPAAISEVKRLLRAIDYESAQVLIETKFVEITESGAFELGLNWGAAYENDHVSVVPQTDANGNQIPQVNTNSAALGGARPPTNGLEATLRAFNLGSFPDFSVALDALEEKGKADTLSEPRILTLNNATGVIEITQDISYISGYQNLATSTPQVVNPGNGGTVVQQATALVPQFSKDSTGITLTIMPSVARNGEVITLSISPTVRELIRAPSPVSFQSGSGSGTPLTNSIDRPPEFDTRRLFTSLRIQNGQTVALGGLTRERDIDNQAGVPFLSRVPGLGLLFRRTSKETTRRNLVIFVTAHIVDPSGARIGDEIRRLRDTARVVLPEDVRAEADRNSRATPAAPAEKPTSQRQASGGNPWDKGRGR